MQKKKNKENQTIIFFIVLILVVAFIFMLNGKKEAAVVAAPTPQPQPAPMPEPDPLPTPAPVEVKKQDSFIVFYTLTPGAASNSLLYELYSDYDMKERVDLNNDNFAVVGYFPSSNKAYLVEQTKDTNMQIMTKGNKLFLVNYVTTKADKETSSINVIDPITKNKLYTLNAAVSDFAVVGNSIFYRDSSGDLWKVNLDGTQEKKLANDDPDNVGVLYSIQESLVTVYHNTGNNEYAIREHDLDSGKITKTSNTIPATGNLKFYGGETAFYIVAQDETKQKRYYIYRIELGDTAETLIGMDLDESESAIAGVDEHNGKLYITIDGAAPGIADSVVVHDMAKKESKEINFDPKISYTENPPEYFSLD